MNEIESIKLVRKLLRDDDDVIRDNLSKYQTGCELSREQLVSLVLQAMAIPKEER